ncbi:hypothetical protein [Pseudorhizobium halotolerans]|uniref:hypothetical protein n=1 Tax=Pseudorhizobium halotolerans TaxID=1233081 RepID=UPI003CC7C521
MLPPVIARFRAEHPQVTVEILSGPYDAIERMVQYAHCRSGLCPASCRAALV